MGNGLHGRCISRGHGIGSPNFVVPRKNSFMNTSSRLYVGADLMKLICAQLIVFMHTYNHDWGVVGLFFCYSSVVNFVLFIIVCLSSTDFEGNLWLI